MDINDLDNLNEDELMAALSDLSISDTPKSTKTASDDVIKEDIDLVDDANVDIQIDNEQSSAKSVNVLGGDIASLLKELLNNKTLEITIKIKDN